MINVGGGCNGQQQAAQLFFVDIFKPQ